jgi:hypothetical protein
MTEVEISFQPHDLNQSLQKSKLHTIDFPREKFEILKESAFQDELPFEEVNKISLWYFELPDKRIGAFGMNVF